MLTATDTRIYTEELKPWLPRRIFDCHVHISLRANCGTVSPDRFRSMWALEVGIHQTWAELRRNYQVLFPDQDVSAMVFGGVFREIDTLADNRYVLSEISGEGCGYSALFVTRPEMPDEQVANALSAGFVGLKPYPDLCPSRTQDISIYDFLPPRHLDVLSSYGGILMLHLPRADRLADPSNIHEVSEIATSYPSIRIVLAHIGRAYCLRHALEGLKHFRGLPNVVFDTSANLNADVFTHALEVLGPERILFGTDLPITMMRGARDHVGDSYINWTNGDYSWNTVRKPREQEEQYTFFVYQELRALIEALGRCGMGPDMMERIMYSNARRFLRLPAGEQTPEEQTGRLPHAETAVPG